MNDSYLEKCIRSLPLERQSAARAAFKEIAEDGDDSVFSKVLVTLEATSAYAASLPKAVTASGESLLQDFDARAKNFLEQQAQSQEQLEESFRAIIRQEVPALGKSLALDKVAAGLDKQATQLGRIDRSISRLRLARVGGLLLLMALGALLGAAGLGFSHYTRYQEGQQAAKNLASLHAAGIGWDHAWTEHGVLVRIEGPPVVADGLTWRQNANGQAIGIDILFSSRTRR